MEDSPNDMDSFKGVPEDQSEDSCRNTTRDIEENLPSVPENASENQYLPSPTQAKVSGRFSNQSPTPSFQAPNIDQLEKTSKDVYPSNELNSNNCSRNEGALISPRQLTGCSMSILEDSDASKAKANQKDLSPFPASRKADFTSPPERGAVMGNRSLSKNLKETNTPSPEKRSVETDVELTPTKRLRKTSKSGSGKPGTETGSYTSKVGPSEVSKTFYRSKTFLHFQKIKAAVQKYEESKSPSSPSTPIKRQITKKSSVESKSANDPTLSSSISPSSPANIIDESPSYLQMQGSKVGVRNADESPTERKTSRTKDSNLEDVLQTANLKTFPTEEIKSVSNELTDSSSNNPNLGEMHSTSDESAMHNFTSKKPEIHPITLTDNSFIKPNASGKQKDRLSFDVWQPYLPVEETESTVHPLALADKTSSSNRRPASKSQSSKTEGFEGVEVKKISSSVKTSVSAKKTQSASNVADSAIKAPNLESSQSSPEILNPHLPSSCHLPRRTNSSSAYVPHPKLEFDTSDNTVKNDPNRSHSATRTSTPNGESRSQLNKLPALGHRRSQSDVTLTSRNVSTIQSTQPPTSRSLDTSNDVSRSTCVVQPLPQVMPPRSTSNTISATSNPQELSLSDHYHQLSREVNEIFTSRSRSNPDLRVQQNHNAPLLQIRHPRFFSGDASTSRNQREMTSNVNPMHIDISQGQASTSRSPTVTDGSSDNSLLTIARDSLNSIDIPRFMDAGERTRAVFEPPNPPRSDEFVAHARSLLSCVLRKMILYNGDLDLWGTPEAPFLRITDSFTEDQSQMVCLKLSSYLNKRSINHLSSSTIDLSMHGMTAETFTHNIYERLIASVISHFTFILSVPKTRDYDAFIPFYSDFRTLCDDFSSESSDYDVDDIEDVASRNRVKELQKMIHCLMLQTLEAVRLLLMYIGENSDDVSIAIYMTRVRDEDEMYLRRKIG